MQVYTKHALARSCIDNTSFILATQQLPWCSQRKNSRAKFPLTRHKDRATNTTPVRSQVFLPAFFLLSIFDSLHHLHPHSPTVCHLLLALARHSRFHISPNWRLALTWTDRLMKWPRCGGQASEDKETQPGSGRRTEPRVTFLGRFLRQARLFIRFSPPCSSRR